MKFTAAILLTLGSVSANDLSPDNYDTATAGKSNASSVDELFDKERLFQIT